MMCCLRSNCNWSNSAHATPTACDSNFCICSQFIFVFTIRSMRSWSVDRNNYTGWFSMRPCGLWIVNADHFHCLWSAFRMLPQRPHQSTKARSTYSRPDIKIIHEHAAIWFSLPLVDSQPATGNRVEINEPRTVMQNEWFIKLEAKRNTHKKW